MEEIEAVLSNHIDKFKDKDRSIRKLLKIIEEEFVEENKEDVYTVENVKCSLTGLTGVKHYKNRKLHRSGGEPAVIWSNGDQHYYENGLFHREEGPALDFSGGFKYYYNRGKHIKTLLH